jgi:two-component system, OmpR family, KDP operon response regulator KdpE
MSLKMLVVDDEPQLRIQLKIAFTDYGYDVLTAANGQEALSLAAQNLPDVIVLDISLGDEPDGIEVCRQLREWTGTPIIMLSVWDEEKTKVKALHTGADDYLTKPFSVGELHARIIAIRRRRIVEPTKGTGTTDEIRSGALRIDLANRLVYIGGEEIHLTPKEYDLLCLLAVHRGKVLTHHTILHTVWGPDHDTMDHYVRVFVNQLRRKLREDPTLNIRYIHNEPGIGYRFITS